GHSEQECFSIHPELHPKKEKKGTKAATNENGLKDNNSSIPKHGGEVQKSNDSFTTGNGRIQRKVAKQKENIWSQKQVKMDDQIDTSNMFATLNDQEEVHDRKAKSACISQGESHRSDKKMPDKKDNAKENHEENSQTTGELTKWKE
ncbi:hypothetical protein HAX54_027491, partial [Datura stramonium]|nr:hypothetical protein [Datura stramonium]